VIASRRVNVGRGTSTVSIDARFTSPGAHLVEAVIAADRDALTENNTLAREVVVAPPVRVLYVHANADDAAIAGLALAQAGMTVTKATTIGRTNISR